MTKYFKSPKTISNRVERLKEGIDSFSRERLLLGDKRATSALAENTQNWRKPT